MILYTVLRKSGGRYFTGENGMVDKAVAQDYNEKKEEGPL